MRKLLSFMVTSLDGYYEGPNHEFDWPKIDTEFYEFSVSQMNDIDTLIFGRVTYSFMADYWPSDQAIKDDPEIAERMNSIAKVVFSSSLTDAPWNNSTLVKDDPAAAIAELKQQPGKDLALFGSPTFTASLMEQGLVDELRVMIQPLLWSGGTSLYTGLNGRVDLTLLRTATFSSGNVLLTYRPAPAAAAS